MVPEHLQVLDREAVKPWRALPPACCLLSRCSGAADMSPPVWLDRRRAPDGKKGFAVSCLEEQCCWEVNLFDVKLRYATLGEKATKVAGNSEVKVKGSFVKQGEEGQTNKELDAIVALAQVAQAQIAAEEQAKQGNFIAAQSVLRAAAASVGSRGHERLRRHADSFGLRLADAGTYQQNAGYIASTSRGMTRGMGVASYDASAQQDLSELGIATSNCFQADMADSFSAPVDSLAEDAAAPLPGIIGSGDTPSPWTGGNPLLVVPPAEQAAPEPPPAAPKARVSKKRSSARW